MMRQHLLENPLTTGTTLASTRGNAESSPVAPEAPVDPVAPVKSWVVLTQSLIWSAGHDSKTPQKEKASLIAPCAKCFSSTKVHAA